MRKLGQVILERLALGRLKLEELTLARLTIKSKLQLLLVAVSLISLIVVGYVGWNSAQAALQGALFNQLTSLRTAKADQIESYFTNLRNHVETLGEDRMIVSAMAEFSKGFKQLDQIGSQPVSGDDTGRGKEGEAAILEKNSPLSPVSAELRQPQRITNDRTQLNQESIPVDVNSAIEAYYTKEFFPRLSNKLTGVPNYETYRPKSQAGQYLQYYYIAKNPHPVGKKDELVNAGDKSAYSQVHEKYHMLLRNLIKKFGYYDLFLIDHKTGDIVYTVYKETDFATNLSEGPYGKSNLAAVVAAVEENPERGAIQLVDFKPYRPSYMAPTAFLAGPIYNGSQLVGILAIQLSVNEIDKVLTSNHNWERDGLGKTGDIYLVGSDLRMRSVSRSLIENKKGYLATLRDKGMPESNIQLIDQLNTSVLFQKVDTEAARAAINGTTGTKIVKDYRGGTVVSSYSPVHIEGVDWGIVAKKDIAEAFHPLYTLQNYLIISTVIVILLIAFAASPFTSRFVTPINAMIEGSRKVSAGELDVEVNLNTQDEFGELAVLFNEMVKRIGKQQELLDQKSHENEVLLLNILPKSVAERVKKGEEQIAEDIQQVTVLFANLIGFAELADQRKVEESANILNELIDSFDEEAEKHDVEKLKTISERYTAICGMTTPRLDHTKRMMDFALQALEIVQGFNNRHSTKLSLGLGMHSGSVMAGIVGSKKFMYDVWGNNVNIAAQLAMQAEPNTIMVSQVVYDRVNDLHTFEKGKPLILEGRGNLATWVLKKKWIQNLFEELVVGGFDDFDMDDEEATDDIKPVDKESRGDQKVTPYGIKSLGDQFGIPSIDEESMDEQETTPSGIKSLGDQFGIPSIDEDAMDEEQVNPSDIQPISQEQVSQSEHKSVGNQFGIQPIGEESDF